MHHCHTPTTGLRPAALAFALQLALAGGLLSSPSAWAQAAEAARSYDIPAGPLGSVMSRFASASGVLLAGSADLVQRRNSPGLSGRYTVREAIQALLAGTGLEALRQSDGSYTLRPAATPQPGPAAAANQPLPEVRVTATGEGANTTEGSGSYTTRSMSTATRLPLSIRETPQSVTVITHDRMEDQGLTRAKDVMDNAPGITVQGTAPYRETYYSRGFEITNYMFDGLTVGINNSRAGMFLNDLAMYDRVEVVRGSAGLTQGTGTPSAAINFVRKRPTREFQGSVQAFAGSWNHYGAQLDVGGPLNPAGTLRGRIVAQGLDSDSFQDVVTEKRQLFYAIGEADLAPGTLLTAGLSYQRNDNITTYGGLPTALDGADLFLPRSTFLGNRWNYWDDQTKNLFGALEHRLGADWKLKLSANQIWGYQQQSRAGVYYDDATSGWIQNGGQADVDSVRTSIDLHAQGAFEWLGRRHELVVGASTRRSKESNDTAGYWGYTFATGMDIFHWRHDAPEPAFSTDYRERTLQRERGVYTTVRFNPTDALKLIAGLRLDWYRFDASYDVQDFEAPTWTQSTQHYATNRHVTKYAGLVYDLDTRHSVYASYTDIFQPQDARDTSNNYIVPIVGKNHELGIKGAYLDGALNLAASVFLLDQANRAVDAGPCPFNPILMCSRPAGVVRSKGVDLEAQGSLARHWQVGAGYTFVGTKMHKDLDPAAIGTRLNTELPRQLLRVSTSYRLPQTPWRFGANLRWQSRLEHTDDWSGAQYHTEQGGYTLFDAMLGYQFDQHIDLQLNVSNLFDKRYYRSISGQPVQWGGNAVYGEPRRVLLTARYKF